MEWLLPVVLGAIATKLVGMAMDVLMDRWRNRPHKPLTLEQARRRHAIRFSIAAVSCAIYAWFAWVLVDFAISNSNAVSGGVGALLAIGAILFARSALRRWARYRDPRAG
jgi:hypothetical protein